MDIATLQALGIKPDDLVERIVEQAVEVLLHSTGYDEDGDPHRRESDLALRVQGQVKDAANAKISAMFERHVLPNVEAYVEGLTLQQQVTDLKASRDYALKELGAARAAQGGRVPLTADQVEWVVNDIAELGVKIGNQFFFLYKGHSLVYGSHGGASAGGVCLHDSGEPMHWRPVGKREFGECCHPVNYEDLRKCGHPHYIGTVSLDDSYEWKPFPSANGITTPAGDSE